MIKKVFDLNAYIFQGKDWNDVITYIIGNNPKVPIHNGFLIKLPVWNTRLTIKDLQLWPEYADPDQFICVISIELVINNIEASVNLDISTVEAINRVWSECYD